MNTIHHEPQKQDLIKEHIDSFPVLPTSVTRLLCVTSVPDSSAEDVMEVILPDQSLCLTILKIANSALFGRPRKVDSLTLAISVLGFNEVQRIALTKALINSFSKLAKKHKSYIDRHWLHSFVCGITARMIAQDLRINPDIAFLGGLIHDIGKLIMLETFEDDYAVEYWMSNFSNQEMLQNESRTFSFTHDEVAGQLLKKWSFPENLITAVSHHHRPNEALQEKGLAHIIQLSDILAFYCCHQESLGDDGLLTAIHNSIPNFREQWQNLKLPIDNDIIIKWFNWLMENYEQGSNLKEAFSD